ncbi:ribulose bisphosphate carboxylase small subunit, chloroplastic-like [Andrographis paniculata]|uniref:ribulose bisphosphate carboxylase small subunit, chloroplastic-like n=1 Tax=Andrographis paniculata TaxID=175694 RepID=UPI0021E916A4|nr:ribulose bisphosphate carboxylase small subunit, chloroplastic-like [Andrographis paniculata]
MASSVLSTAAAAAAATPAQATKVAPFVGLKSSAAFPVARKNSADITSLASNGGRVSCMKVWPTEGKRKFETLSYLPTLTREQLLKQVEYLLRLKLIPCLEFTIGPAFPYRENHRSPGYYDGRYWTMWKLPMFGCTDAVQVLQELDEAVAYHPQACVRIIGFDPKRQVQIISFIAHKRPGLVWD